MKLTGKTIIVTGGTRGIGLELAKQLMALGNTVLVTGRDAVSLEAVREVLPGIHTFQSDVSDPEQITLLYQELSSRFPTLDILINNAGVMRNINLTATPDLNKLTSEIAIGLSGPILLTQCLLHLLQKRPEAMIVNVSSGLALIPFAIAPIYSAAKAGLHAYTRCLRTQLRHSNVRVVELLPPGTETLLFRREFENEMKGQKAMPVDELVRHAIRGMQDDEQEIRPGLTKVLGLMSRIAPEFMMAQIAKMAVPKP
ncbi:SDR family NAD(P)-dependent oxidoreductase [Pseudomonas sp. MWU16-30317]|uniref:SDR family oxidoreductase n=1 Tax=Pseudomonas sp. MWU16-30317 TaxID=2878095 RepID=UPI001CFB7CFF|nr:SDR family NAD(P)-dependent oxidoreductase [Pseudomonas sp. MWU16-30317]